MGRKHQKDEMMTTMMIIIIKQKEATMDIETDCDVIPRNS